MPADSIGKVWEESLKSARGYGTVSARQIHALMSNEYVRLLARFLKPESRVLEAGCGSGKFSLALAALGYDVVALDYSEQMLENVKASKKRAEHFFGRMQLETVRGDIESFGVEDRSFDLVFNEGVIEHWLGRSDRVRVLGEMKRISRKFVAVIVPNGQHFAYEGWMRKGYPGYTMAPPMTLYRIEKLSGEFRSAGLDVWYKDGLDCWSFINFWPRYAILKYPKAFLSRFVPLPRRLRSELGINLMCIGRTQ